jgi:hypothetical protein
MKKTGQIIYLCAAVFFIGTMLAVFLVDTHRSRLAIRRMLTERDKAWQHCLRPAGQGKTAGSEFDVRDYVEALHEIDPAGALASFQLAWFQYESVWETNSTHAYIFRLKPGQPPPADDAWTNVLAAALACKVQPEVTK